MACGLRRLYGADGAAGRARRVSTRHDDHFVIVVVVIVSSLDIQTKWEGRVSDLRAAEILRVATCQSLLCRVSFIVF